MKRKVVLAVGVVVVALAALAAWETEPVEPTGKGGNKLEIRKFR